MKIRGQPLAVIGGFGLYLCGAMLRKKGGVPVGDGETAVPLLGIFCKC
jgi:hypothetical protein